MIFVSMVAVLMVGRRVINDQQFASVIDTDTNAVSVVPVGIHPVNEVIF
jgi:hypothetical protein